MMMMMMMIMLMIVMMMMKKVLTVMMMVHGGSQASQYIKQIKWFMISIGKNTSISIVSTVILRTLELYEWEKSLDKRSYEFKKKT